MRTTRCREAQHDARLAVEAEAIEHSAGLGDIPRQHIQVRVQRFIRRRAARAYLVEIAGCDVADTVGTKSVEGDGSRQSGCFEGVAKPCVVGGKE